jgi:hypothetical protein
VVCMAKLWYSDDNSSSYEYQSTTSSLEFPIDLKAMPKAFDDDSN